MTHTDVVMGCHGSGSFGDFFLLAEHSWMLKRVDVIVGYTRCLPVASTPAFILSKDH